MEFSLGPLLLVLLSFAAPNSRLEPPPIGTRIPNPIEEEQVTDASRRMAFTVVQWMGACVVKADPSTSVALLVTVPGSETGRQALDKLKPRLSKCLGKASQITDLYGELQLKLSDSLLRGAIAEALYRLQFRTRPPSVVTGLNSVGPILPADQTRPDDHDVMIAYAFAQCLTQERPLLVRRLALSKIGSDEELASYSALTPAMAPCLVTGMTLKINRSSLRFTLAESLYRWSTALAPPAPPGASR